MTDTKKLVERLQKVGAVIDDSEIDWTVEAISLCREAADWIAAHQINAAGLVPPQATLAECVREPLQPVSAPAAPSTESAARQERIKYLENFYGTADHRAECECELCLLRAAPPAPKRILLCWNCQRRCVEHGRDREARITAQGHTATFCEESACINKANYNDIQYGKPEPTALPIPSALEIPEEPKGWMHALSNTPGNRIAVVRKSDWLILRYKLAAALEQRDVAIQQKRVLHEQWKRCAECNPATVTKTPNQF